MNPLHTFRHLALIQIVFLIQKEARVEQLIALEPLDLRHRRRRRHFGVLVAINNLDIALNDNGTDLAGLLHVDGPSQVRSSRVLVQFSISFVFYSLLAHILR